MNDDGQYYEDEDEFGEAEEETRDNPVRTLRKRGDALAKENKELKKRLDALEAERREEDLAKAFRDAGVNEKVAKLAPEGLTADKVGEWLEEYGDVFGVKNAAQEPSAPVQQDPEVQQMQAMQAMSATGSAPSTDVTPADLTSAPSYEAFLEIMRRAGNSKF